MSEAIQISIFDIDVEPTGRTRTEKKPTYHVSFFDRDQRQRDAWYRAKNEDEIKPQLYKDYGRNCDIIAINLSSRTLEEIEDAI